MTEGKTLARQIKDTGWLLALHYLAGEGMVAEKADPVPDKLRGRPWLYADDVLLGAGDWHGLVSQWQDSVETLALWVSDCRYTDKPGARIDRDSLRRVLDRSGWDCLEDDHIEGRAFLVYRRNGAEHVAYRPWRKREKHCLVVRGGAHGDGLMASSVLPALKAEGWTIDFACNEAVHEILRHDPHIDGFVLGRRGQVVDANVGEYWAAIGARYDRVVNLSYSVEHTLLKRPWDGAYFWPHDQRKRLCAGSYLAKNHELAAVPGPYRVKFYPTPEEEAAAAKTAAAIGPFALWVLRGGGIHKWYPFTAQVVTRLLAATDLSIVLSGGPESLELESRILDSIIEFLGPAAMKRVLSMVNTGPLRRVLAIAQRAAVVIGPETAVLNAVGQEPVPKVCFLSHSSPSNLTDDWQNAVPLTPTAPCWPCHRLHYGHEYCPQDPRTQAALCQASLAPEEVFAAIHAALALRRAPEFARGGAVTLPVPTLVGDRVPEQFVPKPNGHIPEVPDAAR